MLFRSVGRLVGRRGVSDRALAGATALLGVYLVVRFGLLASNLQGMSNDSGYFFERLGPAEIRARFGTGWSRYNVYSMVSALGSVLFSEPRGGVLLFGRSLLEGDVPPRRWITVLVSSGTTLLIAAWAWRRLRERRMDEDLRDLAVGAAVLIASAVASFAYAKDEVMGVAGACYAVVAFWAVRDTLATRWRPAARVCVMLGLVVAGTGWAVRTVGLTVALRARAFDVRNEWAVTREEMQARGAWPSDASTQRVVEQLRREALDHPSSSPWFLPRWTDRIFDSDYF